MLSAPYKDFPLENEGKSGGCGKEKKFVRGIKVVWGRQGLDLRGLGFGGESDFPYGDGPQPQSGKSKTFTVCPNDVYDRPFDFVIVCARAGEDVVGANDSNGMVLE